MSEFFFKLILLIVLHRGGSVMNLHQRMNRTFIAGLHLIVTESE